VNPVLPEMVPEVAVTWPPSRTATTLRVLVCEMVARLRQAVIAQLALFKTALMAAEPWVTAISRRVALTVATAGLDEERTQTEKC
jgi:hypothetical protein